MPFGGRPGKVNRIGINLIERTPIPVRQRQSRAIDFAMLADDFERAKTKPFKTMNTAASHSKTILVTGASTGIRLALARMLRESHHRVMITARASSMKRFQDAGLSESENFLIRALDVTDGH